MADYKEAILSNYPNVISYECSKIIIEQMERNICKINIGQIQGTGFFCKIPFPNKEKMLHVLMTNNHIINDDILNQKNVKIKLDIKEEDDVKEILLDNNRMKYTNEEYDITIIEIKEEDNIHNYLELDDIIINDILNNKNRNKDFINETIYIIQYPENRLSVSYGILNKIYEDKKYNFNHKCSTRGGSSGSPILNINNKIGIHKEGNNNKQYNKGTFLNYPIKAFIELNNNNNNEILLQEFNNKYHLNIQDTKINQLDCSRKNLGNEGLNDLSKIEFKELKELYLSNNNISDIKVLEKVKFDKLEILDLRNNQITDINILEKVNFKELKVLILGDNEISDIKVLEKAKFDELEVLDLCHNQLPDINILEKEKFKELKKLYLDGNNISDIKVLEKAKFDKLEILNLCANPISEKENESIISKLKTKIKEFNI